MKITSTIARYLLGLIFTVFGLNGFLQFIPMSGTLPPVAGQFLGALAVSQYMTVVFTIELVAGILFLTTRYVPLAVTIIGPVIVNILLFHIFMAPQGLSLAAFVTVLWAVTAYSVRTAFRGILAPYTPEKRALPNREVAVSSVG